MFTAMCHRYISFTGTEAEISKFKANKKKDINFYHNSSTGNHFIAANGKPHVHFQFALKRMRTQTEPEVVGGRRRRSGGGWPAGQRRASGERRLSYRGNARAGGRPTAGAAAGRKRWRVTAAGWRGSGGRAGGWSRRVADSDGSAGRGRATVVSGCDSGGGWPRSAVRGGRRRLTGRQTRVDAVARRIGLGYQILLREWPRGGAVAAGGRPMGWQGDGVEGSGDGASDRFEGEHRWP
ncbi:uncharacterized protein A4U43_C04F34570 [Asparagus officinalis]|uniref:Uncharacterized protein n=1 Tax=Asparagus officinalis TaxID=4686 RepID=A0A5P1FAP9_ASPOF|nr:uncharacterized protein A4U43_C04F34570 [Asparagus officinalis]